MFLHSESVGTRMLDEVSSIVPYTIVESRDSDDGFILVPNG